MSRSRTWISLLQARFGDTLATLPSVIGRLATRRIANHIAVVPRHDLRHLSRIWLPRHVAQRGDLVEIADVVVGCERVEEPCRLLPWITEAVRHADRCENPTPDPHPDRFLTHHKLDLPFENVEPFLVRTMHMWRRAGGVRWNREFGDRQRPTRVRPIFLHRQPHRPHGKRATTTSLQDDSIHSFPLLYVAINQGKGDGGLFDLREMSGLLDNCEAGNRERASIG